MAFFHGRPRPAGNVPAAGSRRKMVDFRLADLSGSAWQLSDRRGRVVLVNFWATWCPPCREETPGLVQLYRSYRPRGVEMVGIDMDDDPAAAVPGFVRSYRIPYPMLVPDSGFELANEIESLPTTLLIDRQGRIAKVYVGAMSEAELSADLDALLKESS